MLCTIQHVLLRDLPCVSVFSWSPHQQLNPTGSEVSEILLRSLLSKRHLLFSLWIMVKRFKLITIVCYIKGVQRSMELGRPFFSKVRLFKFIH